MMDLGNVLAGAGAIIGSAVTFLIGRQQNSALVERMKVERQREDEQADENRAQRFDKSIQDYLTRLEDRLSLLEQRLAGAEAALDEERRMRRAVEEKLMHATERIRQLEMERERLMQQLRREKEDR